MGRLFVEFVDDDGVAAKFACARCGCDVASERCLLWEGFAGASKPALLFRAAVNLEAREPQRQETLSTGTYTLCDVQCRCCRGRLGWRYITSESPEQKYKEGAVLLEQAALRRINGMVAVRHGGAAGAALRPQAARP